MQFCNFAPPPPPPPPKKKKKKKKKNALPSTLLNLLKRQRFDIGIDQKKCFKNIYI